MEQGRTSGITSSSPAPVLSMEVAGGALGQGQLWLWGWGGGEKDEGGRARRGQEREGHIEGKSGEWGGVEKAEEGEEEDVEK